MNNPKILIQGGYGFRNWGDDLQLCNNVRLLKESGFTNLTVTTSNPYIKDFTKTNIGKSFHYITNDFKKSSAELKRFVKDVEASIINNKNSKVKQLIKQIKEHDVLFFSGSGCLNSRHWLGLANFALPLRIAKHFNKVVVLSGQGFGPFGDPEMDSYIVDTLNMVDVIHTRDFELGYKSLLQLGVPEHKIIKGIDDAFTSVGLPSEQILSLPDKMVVINVSCFIQRQKKLKDMLYTVAVDLKRKGYNPVFNYFQNDKIRADECAKGDFPVVGFTRPEEVPAFFEKAVGTIGMRYHSTILSIANHTPVINLYLDNYQKTKIEAIQKETGLVGLGMSGNTSKTEDIITQFEKVMTEQPKQLQTTNQLWRPKANLGVKWLIDKYNPSKKVTDYAILNLIKERRSIRKFKSTRLNEVDLLDLIDAGIHAPSGSNTQCYRFKIINNPDEMKFLGDNKLKWISDAPSAILVYADKTKCPYLEGKRSEVFELLPVQDCAMAMQNICILAQSKGIGQCVIQLSDTWPTANKIKDYFKLNTTDELMGIVVLGYPDEIVDYNKDKHAQRSIKRMEKGSYLL